MRPLYLCLLLSVVVHVLMFSIAPAKPVTKVVYLENIRLDEKKPIRFVSLVSRRRVSLAGVVPLAVAVPPPTPRSPRQDRRKPFQKKTEKAAPKIDQPSLPVREQVKTPAPLEEVTAENPFRPPLPSSEAGETPQTTSISTPTEARLAGAVPPLREEKIGLYILTPSPKEAPHSSLSYMMEVVREAYGTEEGNYYIHRGRLLADKLLYDLSQAEKPVVLIGTSFSFVHFIDFLMERPETILLPPGSKMMDTGGFKGKSRTVSSHWLYAMIEKRLGIPVEYCCNEYGMAEMTSQFYDGVAGVPRCRTYHAPPQTRWQILSPFTLKPVIKGEAGLLAIHDLANIDSVSAILTEDLVRELTGGFELMGRATGAEIKGCSVDLDTLLGS